MQQRKKLGALSLACIAGLQMPQLHAAEWTTGASVAPGVVFTDNVCLTPDNEESDVYGIVTPSFNIAGKGRRANLRLSTSIDLNNLSDGSLRDNGCGGGDFERDTLLPNINAAADAILIDQWLFIDADATASQNEVSSFVAGGDDRADRRGNTNTTYRYSISPYIARRFKDLADFLLRYTYDDQYNTKDIVGESTENSALARIDSGTAFGPLSFGVEGNYSKVDYDDTPGRDLNNDSELKSAQFNLAYQLNRNWAANGYYGQEWNDFVSSRDDIDGDYWGAGGTWTPNSRTTVSAGTGDRFFGSTPWFNASHRYRRSLFSVDYQKTLTYSRDIRTLGAQDSLNGQPTSLTNSPILDERFTLGYAYTGKRFNLGLNASYSDQTREGGDEDFNQPELDLNESEYTNINLTFSRPLAAGMSFSSGIGWADRKPKDDDNEFFTPSETWTFDAGLSRPFSDSINTSLNYRYTDRSSDNRLNEYQENRITFTVRINLL